MTIDQEQKNVSFAAGPKVDKEELRRGMWRSIRILRKFTVPVLMQTVPGTSERFTRKFVRDLLHAGFVKKHGAFVRGQIGEHQRYELLNDTGPMPPVLGANRD